MGELSGQHERGILDFKFSETSPDEAWSIGGDGNLVQWNVSSRKALQSISLPESSISVIGSTSVSATLLCASTTPYILKLDKSGKDRFTPLHAMSNSIHSLYGNKDSILASDGDRYINVYTSSSDTHRLSRTLIAQSGVQDLSLDSGDAAISTPDEQQLLAALGKDGIVELFPRPFAVPQNVNGELKSKRKAITQKPSAQVKLVDSAKKSTTVFAASVQGPDILLASVSSGVDLSFQKVRWQDEGSGELLFTGVKEVVQVKSVSSLTSANTNGVKDMGKPHVDESSTVVTNGLGFTVSGSETNAIAIESSDEEDGDSDSPDEAAAEDAEDVSASSDEEMADAPPAPVPAATSTATSAEPTEPTFGDLLAASSSPHQKAISISIPQQPTLHTSGALTLPTGMSLSTVLTQSLRTSDTSLLEACLHTSDPAIIRNTLTRLDPALSPILISKLADRIVSRPGRYGHLQIWVQHLCVAHGAAISANAEARERLKTLYRALEQRARGLPSLLLLKGKLQMVEGQLRFRREIAAQRAEAGGGAGNTGAAREVNVFIEGGADNWDSEDDLDDDGDSGVGGAVKPAKKRARKALDDLIPHTQNDEEEEEDEEMPLTLTNGVSDSDSDNEEHSSSDESDAEQKPNGVLLDDEALEEGSDDSDDEDDAASADDDEDEDEEDEEEGDSELDAFINDGDISVEENDALLDDATDASSEEEVEEKVVEKPKKKRRV